MPDPNADATALVSLTVSPLTRLAAEKIVRWRYPPPYDIYNLAYPDPSLVKATIAYLTDPANHFYQMSPPNGPLTAFCSFGDDGQVPGGNYKQPALDIGMGVRPDLTGHGWGHLFAATAVSFACRHFHPPAYRVTIAAFNQRAQKVWRKIGFTSVLTFRDLINGRRFITMEKEAEGVC